MSTAGVRELTLERAGSILVVLIAAAVLVVVGVSAVLSIASDDLFASIDEARGIVPQTPRSQPGVWLSTRLAADLAPDDLGKRRQRADQLAYRSERVREAASVAAVGGLFVALLTARAGAGDVRRDLDASNPAANTASNGRV